VNFLLIIMKSRFFIYQEMKMQGIEEDCLQLLRDVSGVFRPCVLTASVGVTCKWCWKDNFDGCSCWSKNWMVH
jgi:hypothetical protein